MNTVVVALVAALLCVSAAASGQTRPQLEVKSVTVHLLLTPSGVLTEDVLGMEDFESWNSRPLSDKLRLPTDQRFYDFLIKVRLSSDGEVLAKRPVGSIEVHGKKMKQLVARAALQNIYLSAGQEYVTGLLVRGHTCEPVVVTVSAHKSRIVRELQFACGE